MIKVHDLSFTYPGNSQAVLKKLTFEIKQGEIFGFLGPSGAGKSTTQKILYKILHGFQGEIMIHNKPLSQWGKEYFEHIGVGFELPNHYLKLTARENLQLFASFYQKEELLPIPVLFEMVGLEDSMDKKVEAYSKGMKMRLNFIRAIMHQPNILFFDEPTAGLDPVNAHKVKAHIMELKKQGKTIFITTHNMNTADELCDRVSFIVDGQLQVTEVPAVLKQQYGKDTVKVELKDATTAEFPLKDLGYNSQFLELIRQNELLRINTQEATLEEVFIQVTGKALKV
ncbi:ABC transporter ATP-binding protein [Catalinimonas niigatensis]|uniref:ABC transporter ATP-binding protein n=1 Tax=Catalinimonas niigatensis TaxID=1397264 RepID=UPI002665AA58|nr:ABC transporter ATP-binding protein [Catalinimonas niigatensis]WPP48032.1 ABC transporter ATP-binding protein [Catalinimonas niigatensis]